LNLGVVVLADVIFDVLNDGLLKCCNIYGVVGRIALLEIAALEIMVVWVCSVVL